MFFLNVEDPRFYAMPLKSRNDLVLSFFPEDLRFVIALVFNQLDFRKNIIVEARYPPAKKDREVFISITWAFLNQE